MRRKHMWGESDTTWVNEISADNSSVMTSNSEHFIPLAINTHSFLLQSMTHTSEGSAKQRL